VKTLKPGDCVEVIGNAAGHNIAIGSSGEVVANANNQVRLKGYHCFFYPQDLKALPTPKSVLKERYESSRKEVEALKDQIEYLESSGKDELDEENFREYRLAQIIQNANLSASEKSKRIRFMFDN